MEASLNPWALGWENQLKRHVSIPFVRDWMGGTRGMWARGIWAPCHPVSLSALPCGVHLICRVMGKGHPAQPLLAPQHLPGSLSRVFCGHWCISIQNSGVITASGHSMVLPVNPSHVASRRHHCESSWEDWHTLNGLWRWSYSTPLLLFPGCMKIGHGIVLWFPK